jgi:putative flippase GtrA
MSTSPVPDVVVPVHSEERSPGPCVLRLTGHLRQRFPYPFRVTIADNDSTDHTWEVVADLADRLPGVARMRRTLRAGTSPLDEIRARIGRPAHPRQTVTRLWRFGAIGVLSTVLHLGLFALLRPGFPSAQWANLLALLVATVFNTAANRRWTFGVRGRQHASRHQLQGLVVFAVTWALTGAALAGLRLVAPHADTTAQIVAIAVANALSTGVRFVAMQRWIFRGHGDAGTADIGPADVSAPAPREAAQA